MVTGNVPEGVADYQWSALLMAIVLAGDERRRNRRVDRRHDELGPGG